MSDPSAKQIAEAILEVAAAMAPHSHDRGQREQIAAAISTLIDAAIAKTERRCACRPTTITTTAEGQGHG